VVQRIRELGLKQVGKEYMTGTQITNDILKQFNYFRSSESETSESKESIFKNIQRRVYDTINVLDALNVISKNKNIIIYNPDNEFFKCEDATLRSTLKNAKKSEKNDILNTRKN
jgi:hypothetical protein